MILDKIYISSTEPIVTNVLWAKPLDGGAFSLYAFLSGKWGLLKLMRDNGTPYPDDDTPEGSADDCYTKEEIDERFADILGLDAEGVAELKALIEDDDALTGLLGELKDEVKSVEVFHYLQGSHKPLPVGKYNYTISGLINVPKCVYNEGNYLIFRYAEDLTTYSFHYLVFEEKTVGEVTGYFCVHSYSPTSEPPTWVEDAFGYTRSEANNLLNNKVDKVTGKGLSTNDYTTAEKTKLGDLPTASELTQTLGGKANTNDLARVATSGSYNDLSDQPTLDDLNKVEDLYALDATNSDWKTKVDKMFDDGTLPTMSKSFDYCNLRIYKKYTSGVEADTTAINSLETTEEGLTFADGTHFSSYKIGAKYYVGYLTSFCINSESTVLGNIEITCTKSGILKLYLYKCAITEDAYFQINSQPTDVEMPTTDAATILSFDVNEGDVISVSPTKHMDTLHYYDYGLVGMSFYSKYPVSRFANDAGYLTPQGIAGKADKSEMSVVPGTGADADKTTITLKQGTSATVLIAHQDVSVKEDKMLVAQVASGTTAINAAVNTYYEVAGEVGALAITLPTPTDLSKVSMVVVHLTAGTTPNVVIGSATTIDYSAAYDISAGSEYEINCLFNGDKWVVADMEVV